MHMSRRSLAVSFLVLAVVVPSLATAQPAPAAQQSAFQKEWAEVVKKYPHVAHAYLMNLDALNEGVRYALATDPKAFQTSAFRALVADLCLQRRGDRYFFVACDQVVQDPPAPTSKCRRCGSVCAIPDTVVDCSDCKQRNADAGCLP